MPRSNDHTHERSTHTRMKSRRIVRFLTALVVVLFVLQMTALAVQTLSVRVANNSISAGQYNFSVSLGNNVSSFTGIAPTVPLVGDTSHRADLALSFPTPVPEPEDPSEPSDEPSEEPGENPEPPEEPQPPEPQELVYYVKVMNRGQDESSLGCQYTMSLECPTAVTATLECVTKVPDSKGFPPQSGSIYSKIPFASGIVLSGGAGDHYQIYKITFTGTGNAGTATLSIENYFENHVEKPSTP